MRRSLATQKNEQVDDLTEWSSKRDNMEFVAECLRRMDKDLEVGSGGEMAIVLVGSRDIPGVSIRRAQSVLRWDRRPSLWSHAFLIGKAWSGKSKVDRLPILEVSLFPRTGVFPEPQNNGLQESTLGLYANPRVDSNIAVLAVARRDSQGKQTQLESKEVKLVSERARQPNYDRMRYDLWDSLAAWQRYLWGDGEVINPLRVAVPLPATAYIEMAFEAIGLDLVPAASERNSAPEHVWNAALWWHQRQLKKATDDESPFILTGFYALRDKGCSVVSHDESVQE